MKGKYRQSLTNHWHFLCYFQTTVLINVSGTSNVDAHSVFAHVRSLCDFGFLSFSTRHATTLRCSTSQHVYHMADVNVGYRFVNALYRSQVLSLSLFSWVLISTSFWHVTNSHYTLLHLSRTHRMVAFFLITLYWTTLKSRLGAVVSLSTHSILRFSRTFWCFKWSQPARVTHSTDTLEERRKHLQHRAADCEEVLDSGLSKCALLRR